MNEIIYEIVVRVLILLQWNLNCSLKCILHNGNYSIYWMGLNTNYLFISNNVGITGILGFVYFLCLFIYFNSAHKNDFWNHVLNNILL